MINAGFPKLICLKSSFNLVIIDETYQLIRFMSAVASVFIALWHKHPEHEAASESNVCVSIFAETTSIVADFSAASPQLWLYQLQKRLKQGKATTRGHGPPQHT